MENKTSTKEEKNLTLSEVKKEYINTMFEKGILYKFILLDDQLSLKISKNYEVWEGKYLFQQILLLPMWKSLKNSKNLFNFIVNGIEKQDFELNFNSDPLSLIFKDYSKNMEDVTFEYILPLDNTKKGEPTRIEDLVTYISEFENRLDARINSIEQKLSSHNLLLDNLKLKEEIVILKLGKKIDTQFLVTTNINNHFELSENNLTVKKVSADIYHGIRCNKILSVASNQRYFYSIRIDETDTNSYIRLGFISTTVAQHSGFGGVDNFCGFDLSKNSSIYGGSSVIKMQNYIIPKKNYVFEVVIDFSEKSIYLYFEGDKIGHNSLNIKYQEYTPCVDLYTIGDKVSLV